MVTHRHKLRLHHILLLVELRHLVLTLRVDWLLLLQQHLHVQLRRVHHHIVAWTSIVHCIGLHHHLARNLVHELLASQIHLINVAAVILLLFFSSGPARLIDLFGRFSQVSIAMRVAAFVAVATVAQLLKVPTLDCLVVRRLTTGLGRPNFLVRLRLPSVLITLILRRHPLSFLHSHLRLASN
jgi:hypothetical protein